MTDKEILGFMSGAISIENWNSKRDEVIKKLMSLPEQNEMVNVKLIHGVNVIPLETTVPKYLVTIARVIDSSGYVKTVLPKTEKRREFINEDY